MQQTMAYTPVMPAPDATIVEQYRNAANQLVAMHNASVAAYVASHGDRPTFEELMTETRQLNQQLTTAAIKAIEAARPHALPAEVEQLTAELHRCISTAVKEFIDKL